MKCWNKTKQAAVCIVRSKHMNLRKTLSILGITLALSIILPVLRAGEWNQTTRFTFS